MKKWLVLGAMLAFTPVFSSAQTGSGAPVTTSSKEALALYQQAVDHFENVELDKARALLDQAIQKDPGFAMAYLMRAQSGVGYNQARQNIEKAVGLVDKVSPAERQWIGFVQAQSDGNVSKAGQILEELLKTSPNDKHVALLAGRFYRGIADEKRALAQFERAAAIDPKYAAAHNQTGYAYIALGDFAGAEGAFKKYIASRPDSPNPYDSYAEMLLNQGRYDESIAQYNAALARDPAFPGSLAGLGHNYVFKGDFAKAREAYGRLGNLGTANNRITGFYWEAVSYVYEGKTDEALKAFAQQREAGQKEGLVPVVVSTHVNEAAVLLESRRTAEARQHLAEAAKVVDGSQLPDRNKTMMRRQMELFSALAAAQAKEPAAAAAHLDKAKAMTPPDLPAVIWEGYEGMAGMTEFYQGNYDAALAHFKKAGPDDAYATFYAAEAMRLKGDASGAAALYKKVMASNQNGLYYALVRPRAKKAAGM